MNARFRLAGGEGGGARRCYGAEAPFPAPGIVGNSREGRLRRDSRWNCRLAPGQSCIIKRYCEKRFVSKYLATIGIDYGVTK